MQPLNSNLFVQPIIEQDNYRGLTVSVSLKKGKVLFSSSQSVKVDDIVLYEPGIGISFSHNDIKGLFLKEHQIISIL
jgi:hypothetical protein